MNIGVVCYASVGGSGIVATELAKSLARRNHQVHLISTEPPFRLGEYEAGLAFHRVHTPTYPLFREPQYLLSLANKIVQLVARVFARHRARALRHSARDRRVPRQADSCRDQWRPRCEGAEGHYHAARHGHHAARQRSLVLGNGRVLDRSVRRRHGGVGKPAARHVPGAADQARHPRHSELSRVR